MTRNKTQAYLEQIGGINERIRQLKREKIELYKILRFRIRQRRELLEALENEIERIKAR